VFVDPQDPVQGIIFAGRVVEDFKLTTGTFVHVGSLRTDAIAAATPVVRTRWWPDRTPVCRTVGLAQSPRLPADDRRSRRQL